MNKEKNEIRRENVHDTHMKSVLLRLDYSGVASLDELREVFDDTFPNAFNGRQMVSTRGVSVTLRKEDLNTISKAVSVPVSVIEKERVWQYKGMEGVNGEVTLCISQYYTYMMIQYKDNYDGLNAYLRYFLGAIAVFKNKIPYFCPQRLGIRKCRVQNFKSADEISHYFEPFVFYDTNLPIGDFAKTPREFRTCLSDDGQDNLRVIVYRRIMPTMFEKEPIINTVLDIDAYYDDPRILNKTSIDEIIKIVNEFEFYVYKLCMTLEALHG